MRTGASAEPRRRWAEIYGAAPHPLLGEDAQAWVSQTRREAETSIASNLKVR